ncbi:MAG: YjgP/YjgQ family permease [Bacteroidetes bacterium]|nr:YjgP/YjgQ family permease [Bacteroidota bacterium]
MNKLDKLILKAFIGPFIATFFVTLFVLVMQFFWKYVDDLVGKGLGLGSILELTCYVTATAIPLALPLAILLSSIMTFGNLGESFELVAIQSAGIPLLRFMRPLIAFSLAVSLLAFTISNWVIPVAQLRFTTMLYDIRVAKPAFDIREGIFYTRLPGFAVKVGRKEKEGNGIADIIIYENQGSLQDNVIVAKKGEMRMSSDRKSMEFVLEDGWRYQERGVYSSAATEYYRLGFQRYIKVFDLSGFEVFKTPDSLFKGNFMMLNVSQLQKTSDSLQEAVEASLMQRMNREVSSYYLSGRLLDSGWKATKPIPAIPKKTTTFEDLLPDSLYNTAMQRANDKVNLIKSAIDIIASEHDSRRREIRYTLIEFHKKFSLSFACFVLFMIGAPLGSIIRKGGLGMPLVIAVIFFLVFHVTNMFGEKLSKQDTLTPWGGMWMSTFLLIPIGVFLTYKAMNDSQLFNSEFYFRIFRKWKDKRSGRRPSLFSVPSSKSKIS